MFDLSLYSEPSPISIKASRDILVTDMEFLKTVKRRSFLSEVIYIVLNVGMAIALMLIVRITGSLWPAFILVLLSKWRVLAVRPRFWFANVQADLVSVIVSVGFVVFLHNANPSNVGDTQSLVVQVVLVLLYIGWLLFLRPQAKRVYVVAQAAIALFVGITSIFIMSYDWVASPIVILAWLVGYATARHILSSYDDENHVLLLSLAWGLVLAEISWLAYHWAFAYRLPIATNVLLPQVSIVILCFGFLVFECYDSFYHHQKIRFNDIILPLIFTVSTVAVLVLAFNGVSTGII